MITWFAQTDDGQGWKVCADGVIIEDSGRKKEIVRSIQSGLHIDDRPFGFSRCDDAIWGYLISDIKNNDGRYQVAGFRADRNDIRSGADAVLQCLAPLAIKISPTRKCEFTRALNCHSRKRRGVLAFFAIAVLSILAFCVRKLFKS